LAPTLLPGSAVRTNRIFQYDTAREMLNVHLYFVKIFGCHIIGSNIAIDISSFANSIMKRKADPNVYLKFGLGPMFGGNPMTGMSDLWLAGSPPGFPSRFANWFYYVGGIGISVMFAAAGEKRQGLVGAWHPRQGTNKITIADYREPAPLAGRNFI
jgi:hypothetical protein